MSLLFDPPMDPADSSARTANRRSIVWNILFSRAPAPLPVSEPPLHKSVSITKRIRRVFSAGSLRDKKTGDKPSNQLLPQRISSLSNMADSAVNAEQSEDRQEFLAQKEAAKRSIAPLQTDALPATNLGPDSPAFPTTSITERILSGTAKNHAILEDWKEPKESKESRSGSRFTVEEVEEEEDIDDLDFLNQQDDDEADDFQTGSAPLFRSILKSSF